MGYDGYAPIAAYLGPEGWCLGCELRSGSQNANNGFLETLKRILPLTNKLILSLLGSAQVQKAWKLDRDGKMEAVLSEELPDEPGLRRIVKVNVRTSDASGQLYLESDVSLEGWITSFPADIASAQQVMALYSDHATSEQFHSEFKTGLDLERLPSGKFHTNNQAFAKPWRKLA